jgi:hypothetical protein
MKIAVFYCIVLCVFSLGNAQTALGLNVGSDFNNSSHKNEGSVLDNYNRSDFGVQIGPTLRILLGSDREVTPNAGIIFTDNDDTGNTSQLGFWLGCGYFFHLVHQGIFTFSLGPDASYNFYLPPSNASSNYSRFELNAGVPLNFDFDLYRQWSARISAYAFTFGYSHLKREVISDDTFRYSLTSILTTLKVTFLYSF